MNLEKANHYLGFLEYNVKIIKKWNYRDINFNYPNFQRVFQYESGYLDFFNITQNNDEPQNMIPSNTLDTNKNVDFSYQCNNPISVIKVNGEVNKLSLENLIYSDDNKLILSNTLNESNHFHSERVSDDIDNFDSNDCNSLSHSEECRFFRCNGMATQNFGNEFHFDFNSSDSLKKENINKMTFDKSNDVNVDHSNQILNLNKSFTLSNQSSKENWNNIKLTEAMNPSSKILYTHFVALPIQSDYFIKQALHFKHTIMAENINYVSEKMFVVPEKFHMTLCMLTLNTIKDISNCLEKLLEFMNEWYYESNLDLRLNFENIYSINDNPSNASHLVTKPIRTQQNFLHFEKFSTHIFRKFIEEGYISTKQIQNQRLIQTNGEFKNFTYHVTLLKTLKGRKNINAVPILKKINSIDFGEVHLNTINLFALKNSPDTEKNNFKCEGFYKTSSSSNPI